MSLQGMYILIISPGFFEKSLLFCFDIPPVLLIKDMLLISAGVVIINLAIFTSLKTFFLIYITDETRAFVIKMENYQKPQTSHTFFFLGTHTHHLLL